MSPEIGQKAVDLFVFLAEGASSIEITLTGGEPLLQFREAERLVGYAKKRASHAGPEARVVLKTHNLEPTDSEVHGAALCKSSRQYRRGYSVA